ncbi:MAG: Ig-like domain-containing protein [Acidobacteria bacterium]|nr:Ig-like domain-containing protein [Acidobacteriota bacterium]MXW37860.1 hypothetical protein [Acidobacteriota bacterium]MYA46372.1 hypothetical protein [Acidobacteriota bacterium]MYI39636.1 hypothetical protein [Acidobacteriota bacterium]
MPLSSPALHRILRAAFWLAALCGLAIGAASARPAQQAASVAIEPGSLTLEVGETAQLTATVLDAAGNPVADARVVFFSGNRRALTVTPGGHVSANQPGDHEVTALLPDEAFDGDWDYYSSRDPGLRTSIPVSVSTPALADIFFENAPPRVWAGTEVRFPLAGRDAAGQVRRGLEAGYATSDNTVAVVDQVGMAAFLTPGSVQVAAMHGEMTIYHEVEVLPNPTARVSLEAPDRTEVRTGDVLQFRAATLDASGNEVAGPAIRFAVESRPDPFRPESLGAGAAAQVTPDGRFVAEQPGVYTVVAMSGDRLARQTVRVVPRNVEREIEFLGHARVSDRVTADFWVWEGVDGRDYAVHGTWNAEGHAYFYDVTDPRNMELIDTVQVDARTVNDVKVSEDGTLCVISREGASNRRNGFVMIDCTDPRDATILSSFDQGLTGGVHNVFLDNNHVYAVNNGRRWDVVNVEDPRNPFRVSRFETDTPGRSVHDVWIRDGIAYQAGRSDGLIMVDVGGGGMGGSPNTPVEMGRFPQITGWNHAVWPFRSPSTGKLYVIGGDEAFYLSPRQPDGGGILWEEGIPSRAKGWLHFVDFTDPENPEEVARFELADSGPHNLWVDWEEEIMYVGYFDAGLRVVDVSGDLLGDLYRQGRQIARFFPEDNEGFLANAAFTWGPQPHKGTIFLADFNSGLWAVRLKDSAPDAGGN